jgi:hypothetical protein
VYQKTGYRTMEKILLYRLSRVIEKEKCPGGKRGVPGVPKDYYWLYTTIIDDLMVSLWCPYGVPQGHHSCGNANSWLIGTSHYSEISI